MRRVLVPLDVAPAIVLRPRDAEVASLGGETMGTTWSVKLVQRPQMPTAALRAGIERVLDGVIAEMSTWIADSDISRFNRASPGSWHALPEDFMQVLRCALDVAERSDGAYDPAAGALVDLWGFGPHGTPGIIPDPGAIEAAKSECGWSRLELDGARARQPGGAKLDLSSIAKGFAVDKVSAYLTSRGVSDHLVEIGGELRGQGIKPDGSPWWVAVEGSNTVVALHYIAIATSADSQRFFESNGRVFSHTIDPRTGRPVRGDVASVTVLHRSCMYADAWATALLVLGATAGFALAEQTNLAAQFVLRHADRYEERLTPAWSAMLD